MKAKKLKSTVVPTLLATLFTVPAVAGIETPAPADDAVAGQTAAAIKRETVQFFAFKDEPDKFQLMVAGQPGVHFRLYYSKSGANGKYRRLKGGDGTIDANGVANQIVDFGKLGGGTLHLRLFASDQADFSGEVRMTASAISLTVTKGDGVRMRGWRRPCMQRRPCGYFGKQPAIMGVRGKLPEDRPAKPDDTSN